MTASPHCLRCDSLPPKLSGPGTLHMHFPLAHSRSKLLGYFREKGLTFKDQNGMLSVDIADRDIAPTVAPLMDLLSSVEQADVRVIFQREGQLMQLDDFFDIEPLASFLAKAHSGWLIDMMEEKRLTTWFQPIMHCDDSKRVFAYECLLRGIDDGKVVFPGRIFDVARGSGLLFQLDRAARTTAIEHAARFNLNSHIFINFTPTAIYDPVNCLKSTVETVDRLGLDRGQIVFEVIESDYVRDVAHLKRILDYYRDGGFKVALDDLGSGYSSLNMLGQLRTDFIKLDRELLSNIDNDPYKATIAQKLLETAQELGIRTIAEGIEQEGEFRWLQYNGADYVQGYYFARPAAEPPLLMGAPIAVG